MPQKPVTEQQILDAMEEYSEAWVEQLVRRAKYQRLVLSDETMCAVGNYLEMPSLMDQIVKVRIKERGPYALDELNPPIGSHSVCEVVTPSMVHRLLVAAGGRFNSKDAYRFCDYHLIDTDDALLEQIVRMSDLSRWDTEAILLDLGYTGNINALLSHNKGVGSASYRQIADEQQPKGGVKARRIALGILTAVVTVAFLILGGALLGVLILFAFALALVIVGALSGNHRTEKYPDVRSEYNRRVWADDHDFDADGDSDHNWDADGDKP